MNSSLEYYKFFYHAAKCGSITEAASVMMVSQPAVSQAIKQLEEALNVKLFTRLSKGVRLTPEGKLLFEYVSKGYEEIEEGEIQLARMSNLEAGEVKIGASDMTLQFFLLPYLEQFHEQYPGIKINVSNAPTPETLRLLKEGKIDFGVVSSPFTTEEGFSVTVGREIEDVFIGGRKYIQYKNHMMDFSELTQIPMILLEKNTSTRNYMDDFLAKNKVILNPEFELATSDMIVQFCLRNLGCGCVMRDFAAPYLERGVLFELKFYKMIPKRNFCLVSDEKRVPGPAALKLISMIF